MDDLQKYKEENQYRIFSFGCQEITRRWLMSEITNEQAIEKLLLIGDEFGETTLIDCAETLLEGWDEEL